MIASFNFFLCYDTSHPRKSSDLPITSTTTKNKNDEYHDHERPNTNSIMTSIPIAVKETAETQFTNQEQHVEPILFPEISEEDDDDDDAGSSEEMRNSLTCSQLMSLHALSSVADLSNDPADTSIPNALPAQDDSHPQTTPSQAKDELIRRLRRIFELEEKEELISSHPCWLFRNIVLQGYLYVLTNNLCFYANLPSRQDKLIRSGALRKKTRKTRRFSSHWAILRGRTLSWYESEYDPYFPQDKIDLRDVLEVNALPITSNPQFEVVTPYRTFLFEATDAEEWVNALKKATFRSQNEGENVRITIPYEAILDIDSSNANPVAGHTSRAEHGKGIQDVAVVTIKVIQSQPGEAEMTMDEYFFTNMADEAHFVTFLREKLATINAVSSQTSSGSQIRASIGAAKTIASGLRRSETLRQGSRTPTLSIHRSGVDNALESQLADATNDTSISTPPSASTILSTSVTTLKAYSLESAATGYPPSPHIDPASIDSHLAGGDKRWVIPQWLLDASGKLAQNTSGSLHAITNRLPTRLVREQWSAQPLHDSVIEAEENHTKVSLDASHEDDLISSIHSTFSILEDSEAAAADVQKEEDMKEQESLEQFRSCFSLPDEEELLHHTSTNLYRILPVSGRLFVSTNYVCFRSSRLATKTIGRTMMILPRKEIISVAKNNAVQYGRHGLVIIVRGHEELFFEFVSTHRRDQCISIIELQPIEHTQDDDDEEGVPSLSLTDLGFDVQSGSDSSQNLSVPSLFASSSSFVPTKPKENMHFTFLTVGSRGDVQPYIALARGLQKEGHRVRIATHAEFGKWIESFSIEFCEIGGDPAELMKICIENGTFTLAFVRESVTKFRGWLDDLLLSCWHACQGTDVIIESPSAIAGIHIAEALRIPYYRAFTMPWTRTRSYPHAFAVPSRRAGGNYNYMSYVIFDQVFWRASAGQINEWRKKCLRLMPTNMEKLEQHKIPFLYNFSPSLVPKPLDWSDWIHVCGFWFLDNADETGSSQIWQAPKELIDFIAKAKEDQKKIVYIGWGSIVIADADAVLQTVIEAVRKSDVCAIISRGWSDRLQESKDPATRVEEAGDDVWRNIFTIQSVPHDWLFPQMDAACHHGGSGTLGASLRAGIPTIVRPFFGDQFFWASQVESLQIGVSVANKPFTVDTFANALRLCTTDVRMKRNARTLADSIAKEKGVANAIRAIYADWDYACSRVKPNLSAATTLLEPGLPIKTKTSRTEEEDEEAKSMDEWSVVSGSEEGIADVI